MEIHKAIKDDSFKLSLADSYQEYFSKALGFATKHYKEDMERISSTKFDEVSPEFFFREYCWVVCTSGFNAKIVSGFFPDLLRAVYPLLNVIEHNKKDINTLDIAMQVSGLINNKRKIKAIIDCAYKIGESINESSWLIYRDTKLDSPDKLEELPFIGPITRYHLARNIGLLNFVKPDLHLVRMAANWKFENPIELCKAIQKEFNLPLGIIDLVLWYAASTFGTK
jgi:hypothetical protein